jgi:RHS repeat-associated protein
VERDGRGTPLGLRSAANDYTTILDGLGSVVAIVAQDGSVAARYTYDPYGTTVSASETGPNQPNVVRFAGGIHDETTGLTKFGKRFCNSNLGRFTQQDSLNTVGDPSRGNRYAYAGCNPVHNVDPLGAGLRHGHGRGDRRRGGRVHRRWHCHRGLRAYHRCGGRRLRDRRCRPSSPPAGNLPKG